MQPFWPQSRAMVSYFLILWVFSQTHTTRHSWSQTLFSGWVMTNNVNDWNNGKVWKLCLTAGKTKPNKEKSAAALSHPQNSNPSLVSCWKPQCPFSSSAIVGIELLCLWQECVFAKVKHSSVSVSQVQDSKSWSTLPLETSVHSKQDTGPLVSDHWESVHVAVQLSVLVFTCSLFLLWSPLLELTVSTKAGARHCYFFTCLRRGRPISFVWMPAPPNCVGQTISGLFPTFLNCEHTWHSLWWAAGR